MDGVRSRGYYLLLILNCTIYYVVPGEAKSPEHLIRPLPYARKLILCLFACFLACLERTPTTLPGRSGPAEAGRMAGKIEKEVIAK